MEPFETITIDAEVAACDGGGGALGHPMVYLNLHPAGHAECPYCSRLFVNPAMTPSVAETETAVAAPAGRTPQP